MKRMTSTSFYLVMLSLLAVFAQPVATQTQFVERAKQQAKDKAMKGHFGRSVSISGDLEIVGAPGHDSNAGAAYLFERDLSNGMLTQVEKLQANSPMTNGRFGQSVSIDDNGTPMVLNDDQIIVGAPGENNEAGAAYIFEHSGSAWNLTPVKLAVADLQAHDFFGTSVSISGDRALVGAPGRGGNPGAAYLFERDGSGIWQEVEKLQVNGLHGGSSFGYSVAIHDDWALVGAYKESDTNGIILGAAYVFNAADWSSPLHRLTGTFQNPGSRFGLSVSLNSDWAIIGEWGGNANNNIGAAYIYEVGPWTEVAKRQGPDPSDSFGYSVSIDDNGTPNPNDDRAIVGASGDDEGATNAGAAFLFESAGGAWAQPLQKLQACDKDLADRFGTSVSISGDRAVVGAYLEETGGTDSGAVYVFESSLCGCGH